MKFDPTSADAVHVAGVCAYFSGDLDEGIIHFRQALELDPHHDKAQTMRFKAESLKVKKQNGDLLFKARQIHQARRIYTEALEIDPLNEIFNAKLHFNRAKCYNDLKDYKNCVEDYRAAFENMRSMKPSLH